MKRLYALVVALHPRRFRQEYGTDMNLLFAELLDDPNVSRRHVWSMILGDLAHLTRGVPVGALLGVLVVLVWWVSRSDVIPFDLTTGLALIALMLVAAGFFGALLSGSFAGGISAGFVAGLISAVTVPGDYLLFHSFPFYDPLSFVMTMATSAAVVMLCVAAGAGIYPVVSARRKDSDLAT